MTGHLAASRLVLEELYDGLTALLPTLERAALEWAPLDDRTNSISGLVRHTVGSIDSWLARAVSETIERDRDAEFFYHGDVPDLLALVERSRSEVERRMALLEGLDPGEEIAVRRVMPRPHEARVSRAWCLEHAIIHAGEHWGQIQLTAQLYAARA